MFSSIKAILSRVDVAQLLLVAHLIKILAIPSSFPDSIVLLGLLTLVGVRFYYSEVVLKPQQADVKREIQELKSKLIKLENESKQSQAPVKPPTQRIWG